MTRLIRIGAWASVVGGLLRIAAAVIPYTANPVALETLYGVIDLGFLFALIALTLVVIDQIGRVGTAFAILSIAAIASIVGPDATVFGIDFYMTGASLFSACMAGLAVSLIRAQRIVWPARLWIGSFGFGLISVAGQSAPAFAMAGMTLGAGFVIVGISVLRIQDVTAAPRV